MRVALGVALVLLVVAAGAWQVTVQRQRESRRSAVFQRLRDQNSLRIIAALAATCGELPMKDGAFDPYHFVRKGDITGTNIKIFRSERLGIGPTEGEAKDGDYTNFPWERYRGERNSADGPAFPLLWEKTPDEEGRVLVALSDGSAMLWGKAALDRALAEARVPR